MATKPYAAGGAYINRMSDYCGQCQYRPTERVGERACPFTGGCWWFLDRSAAHLANNRRLNKPWPGCDGSVISTTSSNNSGALADGPRSSCWP